MAASKLGEGTVMRMRIFTVGHSNLEFEEFARMLQAAGVRLIVDVRKLTGSRTYPWFNDDYLTQHLPERGIAYGKNEGLAGRRNVSTTCLLYTSDAADE